MKSDQKKSVFRHHHSHWGAFRAKIVDGRLVGTEGFEGDPHPSPLLQSIPGAVYAQSRVTRPSVRKGWLEKGPGGNRELRGAEPFVQVSWERALDLVAAEMERVRESHGNESIFGGSYGWSSAGRFHHAKSQLHRFLNTIGGFTDQKHSYSVAAGLAIIPHVLGSNSPFIGGGNTWDGIIGNTELMVCFGGIPLRNTQVGPGGPARHMEAEYLKQARKSGADFINISPFRDDMPEFLEADWMAPRPNSDVALMLGLAHTLVSEGLHKLEFLESHCHGYARFEAYLMGREDGQPKDAEWASSLTEIEPDRIRNLARKMADSRTLISTTYSLQRGDHGEQPFWMTVTLAAMLGQIGLPGGGFNFGLGSMASTGENRPYVGNPTLPIGQNQTGSWIPVARITDMLLHPGERYQFNGEERIYPDARLVYWCGGNPFHHHQDLNKLLTGWKKPETIIVNDPWWTATARHADIVLPATTTLERNDIGAYHRDRYIHAMQQAVEPVGEARNDFAIFGALAKRMGVHEQFTEGRSEDEWIRHLYQSTRSQAAEKGIELPTFETLWENGHVEMPEPVRPFVMLEDYRANPGKSPLKTPSGKIEIFSETIDGFQYEDCPGHPAWLEPLEWLGGDAVRTYPLHMISSQPGTRLHAQMDCGPLSLSSKIKGREPVEINPADAAARGLHNGDVVRVFNSRGALLAGVMISEEIRPGVVKLATGAWYDPAVPGQAGAMDIHGNPNMLTPDKGTSRLGQGPIAQSAMVELELFGGDPPEIKIFREPAMTVE